MNRVCKVCGGKYKTKDKKQILCAMCIAKEEKK